MKEGEGEVEVGGRRGGEADHSSFHYVTQTILTSPSQIKQVNGALKTPLRAPLNHKKISWC